MRTFVAKPAEADTTRKWWIIDATDISLGRLASNVAILLRGKHKPTFTPHVDTGDFVIVVNAEKVKLTGQKRTDKKYYHHSGYPGGMKTKSYEQVAASHPAMPLEKAVKGMLPKNILGRELLKKLKVYATAEHPHQAQQPETFKIAS